MGNRKDNSEVGRDFGKAGGANFPVIDAYMESIGRICPGGDVLESVASKEELVKANLKFVVKVAHQYKSMLDLDDLIQEGNIGLMVAAEKFDPKHNVKFISYAVHYVKKYMRMAIDRNFCIKGGKGRSSVVSLQSDVYCGNDGGSDRHRKVEDVIEDTGSMLPDFAIVERDRSEYVRAMVRKHLKNIEIVVIEHRFGLNGDRPKTLNEISKIIGYSIPGVKALETRAKEKLLRVMNRDAVAA